MDFSAGTKRTVSLVRCDSILSNADAAVSVDTVRSADPPNCTGVSRATAEVKRSARLSRKRTLQDCSSSSAAAIEIVGRPEWQKTIKISKSCNNIKPSETRPANDDVETADNRDSTTDVAWGESGSNVPSRPSPITAAEMADDEDETRAKSLPRTYGLRSKHEERNNDLARPACKKPGRASQKSCKGLPADPVEKSHDDESAALNGGGGGDDGGPPKPKRKRTGNEADEPAAAAQPVACDSQLQSRVDREIVLVANRFHVPRDALRRLIESESVRVLREKHSDSVTLTMVTVSPVVSMIAAAPQDPPPAAGKRRPSSAPAVRYRIAPNRESAAYEKTDLKDTMDEISKTMPSWSLSVVADPPRYVLSHVTIGTYGTPVANKAVVLDRHFRASVYINQRLEYKYCRRYTTAPQIVDLVRELDAIQVKCPFL